jgi:cell wall assembly regulator SMI1
MSQLWDRLEQQLLACAPSVVSDFHTPASVGALDAYEEEAGIQLPDEVRQAYLRHDGSSGDENRPSLGLFGRYRWLSLAESRQQLHFNLQNFDEGEPYFYDEKDPSWSTLPVRPWKSPPPQWMAVARLWGAQTYLYVDLLPGPAGERNQLVGYDFHGPPVWVHASSMTAYLQFLVEELDSKHSTCWQDPNTGEWDWRASGGSYLLAPGYRRAF